MSDDFRDRTVDVLLRRTLNQPMAPPSGDCVDGETIAAWMSGAVSVAQASTVERHLAECSRCQLLMAALVRTAPAAELPVSWTRRWRLAWLVPAASAAVALGLWFALPGRGPVPFDASKQALPEASAPVGQVTPAPEPPRPALVSPGQTPNSVRSDVRQEDRLGQSAANEAATAPAIPSSVPATPSARSVAESLEADRSQARAAPAAAADTIAETVAVPAAAAASRALRTAEGLAPPQAFDVVGPDGSAKWQVTGSGRVEWMPSDSTTWEPAAITVAEALTAGSASSNSICWLVGRSGSVFVTTDGLRFRRVPSPEPVDLVAVSAVDGRTATITAADGRAWRTNDQGQTWMPLGR